MYNSNLIELLRTFSAREMKELGEFVRSPFFNKNSNVVRLYDIIADAYPDLQSKPGEGLLRKPLVFGRIFPGKPYSDGTLRMLIYYLFEAAKQYLSVRVLQNSPAAKNTLIGEMQERGLMKEVKRLIRESEKELDDIQVRNADYYMHRFLLEFEKLNYLYLTNNARAEKCYTKNNVENVLDNLTHYYLARALMFYVIVLNSNHLYRTDVNVTKFESLLQSCREEHIAGAPIVELYYHAARALLEPERDEHFHRLKEILLRHHASMDPATTAEILINLENYCVRKMRTDAMGFDAELFEIFKFEIANGYHLFDGYLPDSLYKSIINTALGLDQVEWTREFIEEHRNQLPEQDRDTSYHYGYAWVEKRSGNLARALEHLSKVQGGDILLRTEARVFQAMLYYDLRIDEPLYHLIDALKHFFKNDRLLSEEMKAFHYDCVRFIERLCDLREKRNAGKLTALAREIAEKDRVFNKKWLVEKVGELAGKGTGAHL